MRRKLKLAIFCMCLCWIVAFVQFAMTRFYLSHNDATQAFARNQLILESDVDSFQNLSQKGGQIKGHLSGEMTSSQKEQLASRLFHVWGGVLKDTRQTSDYYVAYGYTSGIAFCKKINGQKIEDVFDYRYLMKDEYVEVLIRKPSGEEWLLKS